MSKICFIVGHGKSKNGGYDSGAVSKDGKYHEFKIAKEIAKYAQAYYNANFAEQCDLMNYDGSLYLSSRIEQANSRNYDFVAEFHLNAGGGTGTECFYSKMSVDGKEYAQAISKAISDEFNVKNRGAKTKLNSSGKDYFGIIRQTNTEAVLIETLFIDTVSDLIKINTAKGQKRCGEAIAKAVAEVRGVKKKTTQVPSKPAAATAKFKENDVVKIIDSNAKYYDGKSVPSWVKKLTWIVESAAVDRVVLGKSTDGKYDINSPIADKYLMKVTATPITAYYPKYTGKSEKLDEVLKAVGVPAQYRGSWKKRKTLAKANGITAYVGLASQNTKLVSLAKSGKLVRV